MSYMATTKTLRSKTGNPVGVGSPLQPTGRPEPLGEFRWFLPVVEGGAFVGKLWESWIMRVNWKVIQMNQK